MSQPDRTARDRLWHWPARHGLWCLIAVAWTAAGISALRAQAPTNSDGQPRTLRSQIGAASRLGPSASEVIGDAQAPLSDDIANLRREGTQLREERGRFEFNGDRITFIAAESQTRFVGLENLNLQRIAQILGGSADSLEWTVNGVITEFQGTNFLLVTRATRATATTARRRSF